MKSQLIAIAAAVVLVGCDESMAKKKTKKSFGRKSG
jgi:hypothetical protein